MDAITGIFFQFLWPIVLIVAGFIGMFVWGKSKQKQGREEAQAESREAVREVETEMQETIRKPRSTAETRRRLEKGDF